MPTFQTRQAKKKNLNPTPEETMQLQSRTTLAALTLSLGLLTTISANAALVSVLGGQAVNDTDLNVTWAANANLVASNTFGLTYGYNYGNDSYGNPSVINSNGTMTWGGAMKWIGAMNANNYLGYSDWRLPTSDTCAGFNCTGSEMGHLFYTELGGVAVSSIATTHNANYSLFSNLQSYYYWSGTEYAPGSDYAWYFRTNLGYQDYFPKYFGMYALAVRPGQVAAVPVPAAAWLLGSGLLGLLGVARRRRDPGDQAVSLVNAQLHACAYARFAAAA
jgi:hypothetical protein